MNPSNKPDRDPLLLDHEADGIQELDNNLPRWWVWLFYLCTVYAFLYMGYYHILNMGDLQASAYDKEMIEGNALKNAAQSAFESSIATLKPTTDPAVLAKGGQLYTTYCSPCHRPDGGGLVGPNLCDDYWIHGDSYADNLKTIINGVPDKGMLSWKEILNPGDTEAVASFIQTFRGTHPPNPKQREDQAPVNTGPNEFE